MNTEPLSADIGTCRYCGLIGVGGIGSGVFFALDGNHTLGREESRGGRFLDRRDYCKLHIICHYVKALLGPPFITIPIGKVGSDDEGTRLLEEMRDIGLDLRYVKRCPSDQTLFSFCFVYPDGSGGNFTVDDSACSKVDAAFVAQAEPEFARFAGRGVALAAPEVPLAARAELLRLGTAYRLLRVASFTSAEIRCAIEAGLLDQTDLLSINLDEAAAAAGISIAGNPPVVVVGAAVRELQGANRHLLLSVTGGKSGSWAWDGESVRHTPAIEVDVVGTAGAGDAHLSGVIVGLVAGLTLHQAQELGTLTAALSVTSPHTINKGIDRQALREFAVSAAVPLCGAVGSLLADPKDG